MLSLHFFTSHDYIYVADVECQYFMFSLVTLYCFVCNIALVTFLGLQYNTDLLQWLTFMTTEKRSFSVLSLVKPAKSVLKLSWNFLKIWSWNFSSSCWQPWWQLRLKSSRNLPFYHPDRQHSSDDTCWSGGETSVINVYETCVINSIKWVVSVILWIMSLYVAGVGWWWGNWQDNIR